MPSTPLAPSPSGHSRLAKFAWIVLGYTLLVILYGAWVRISGSGAGCGDHWPTCHGEMVPRSATVETWIEYGHRLTSGVLGPLCVTLVVWAWLIRRRSEPGKDRRNASVILFWACVTLLFVLFEALIGAGLVLAELVGDDDSGARAIVISLHLVNTLVLTAACALTAWFASGYPVPDVVAARFENKKALLIVLAGLLLVSATGAITALGDTLFPVQPTTSGELWARVRDDLGPGAHFLVRLRAVHPALAIAVGVYAAYVGQRFTNREGVTAQLGQLFALAVWGQLLLGSVNILLSAPAWLQLVHLLGAQLVWVAGILLFVAGCTITSPQTKLASQPS